MDAFLLKFFLGRWSTSYLKLEPEYEDTDSENAICTGPEAEWTTGQSFPEHDMLMYCEKALHRDPAMGMDVKEVNSILGREIRCQQG